MKKIFTLLIVTICIVLCGCQEPKLTCKITSPYDGQSVLNSKELVVRIEVKATKSDVANVVVSYSNPASYIMPLSITLTSEPYTITIPPDMLYLGKLIITAVATNEEGTIAEASVTVNVVESIDNEEKESPDFVTFKDGPLPDGWKTYTWEITDTGFDDGFSLKSANPIAIVSATKTMHAPAYIQFYTKGEGIDLYIDEEKAEALVSEEVGTWKMSIYPFDSGKHLFTWQTEGALKYLDAVSFLLAQVPMVELVQDAYAITSTNAILQGNVISHGNNPIIARGVCWSKNQNPTIDDEITTNGTGLGSFTSYLGKLTPQTTYYVRVYATNKVGTVYSEQRYFKTE